MLTDGDTIIWDSHAIIAYLVRKYGKDDSLYPKDFAKRALVDQRLHFEGSVVFVTIRQIVVSIKFISSFLCQYIHSKHIIIVKQFMV